MLAVDVDCPALFDLLIELDDNYLLRIDDYNLTLNKVLETFGSKAIIVYILFVFGKGEVYRGDGIKIHISAEPGIRHHGAHVHVEGKDGRSATVMIENGIEFKGDLNRMEMKRAKRIIDNNIDVLREIWKTLTIEGISIDIDYKLGRISFRKA